MKKLLSVIIVCILLFSIFSCTHESPNNEESLADRSTYVDKLARNLYIGQTYDEVFEVLGSEGHNIGGGEHITYEWDYGEDGKIIVSFDYKYSDNNERTCVVKMYTVSNMQV